MFERKVILVQLAIFTILLLLIFGTISLTESGILTKEAVPYIIPTAMVASAITSWTIIGRYQRSKVFRPHIENELSKIGYELISERPPTFVEILNNLEIAPAILINGTPIQNFTRISQNERMLHVRRSDEVEFELRTLITKTWSKKYKLKILKTRRMNQEPVFFELSDTGNFLRITVLKQSYPNASDSWTKERIAMKNPVDLV